MKTRAAFDVSYDDWVEHPDSSSLEAAFLSNESTAGLGIWYQLTDTKPTEQTGHSLHPADWVAFDTADGSSVWLKAKRKVGDYEVCRVRLSA